MKYAILLVLLSIVHSSPSYSENECSLTEKGCSEIHISGERLDDIRAAVPNPVSIKPLKKGGVNTAFKVETSSGSTYLQKLGIAAGR